MNKRGLTFSYSIFLLFKRKRAYSQPHSLYAQFYADLLLHNTRAVRIILLLSLMQWFA